MKNAKCSICFPPTSAVCTELITWVDSENTQHSILQVSHDSRDQELIYNIYLEKCVGHKLGQLGTNMTFMFLFKYYNQVLLLKLLNNCSPFLESLHLLPPV